ncbi:MAG: methyltransferase domain-containing protein [Alphaproteobacteria bacterium]|nr:methyltransferase domain-containing protein [Alphaproteobacteria bacterium]
MPNAARNAKRDGAGPSPDTRRLALALLTEIVEAGSALDEVFDHALSPQGSLVPLDGRDRGFIRHLVTTTVRRLGQIDAVLGRLADRGIRSHVTRNILRLGLTQVLFMRTPAHAAVSATVSLVDDDHQRGFVNAVLRRTAREDPGISAGDAARQITPAWLWQRWSVAYGEVTAHAIAEAHLVEPPLDLSIKDPTTVAAWAERLGAEVLSTGNLRLRESGPITGIAGYDEGAWWVQDAAAAIPARLLGALPGKAVVDLCAAPGGKTAQLAAAGARVVAIDISRRRLDRVRTNLDRLGLRAVLIEADAGTWSAESAGFGAADAVMLDAPCTATGTIRRHPDIAIHKKASDVERLAQLQDVLLANAAKLLKPGGTLIYASCSLEPEEGPERISAFLAGHADYERRPISADEVGGLAEALTTEGDLRTLPCHWSARGGIDGFFAARLTRRA